MTRSKTNILRSGFDFKYDKYNFSRVLYYTVLKYYYLRLLKNVVTQDCVLSNGNFTFLTYFLYFHLIIKDRGTLEILSSET